MLFHISSKVEEGVISLLLVSTVLLVFAEVVMRFVFNTGVLWIQELTLLIAGWFVLFGASYGIKTGAHIGVDSLVRMLPESGQRIAGIVSVALAIFYCSLFMVGGWVYLEKVHMIGIELEDMPIPKWIAHSIILIGFGLMIIRLLQLGWRMGKGEVIGFNPSEKDRVMEEVKHLHANEDERL